MPQDTLIITDNQLTSGSATTENGIVQDSSVYAVLDFETTGLNPNQGDRVIEVGISLFSAGQEIDTYASLVNPGFRINSFITQLTGISNQMVASAPRAGVVMQEALDFVGDAQLVAHNASFDKKFWRHELKQTLGMLDRRDFLCTLMLARRVFQSFPSHKLGEIARELNIEAKNSHRALADAQVTTRVLSTLLERLQIAHPVAAIDPHFLMKYQKKTRNNLPDLTQVQQAKLFANRSKLGAG